MITFNDYWSEMEQLQEEMEYCASFDSRSAQEDAGVSDKDFI